MGDSTTANPNLILEVRWLMALRMVSGALATNPFSKCATCPPLPSGHSRRRGTRSEQPSKRRASTSAAAWCTVSP